MASAVVRLRNLELGGVVLTLEGAGHGTADLVMPFARLTARSLAAICPDEIVCALFAAGFDAPQVIARLESLGYGGLITVFGPALPDPAMVERELRQMGPGLRLRLVCAA